ncbi:MAG: thioredoxin family protein [Cytophagaceae bacterium]
MKKKLAYPLLFTLLIALMMSAGCKRTKSASEANEIKWMSYEEAVLASEKKPKKIFVDVYTGWCGWCKVMDKNVFTNPDIIKLVNKHFYPVKLNAESKKTLIYKGKEMEERELARNEFRATGYPTTVYIDSRGNLLESVPGYLEADVLQKVLLYFGEDHYKTATWDQFQKRFVNP